MGNAVFYASPDGLVGLSPGGSAVVTESLFDKFTWQDTGPADLLGSMYENKYVGFYNVRTELDIIPAQDPKQVFNSPSVRSLEPSHKPAIQPAKGSLASGNPNSMGIPWAALGTSPGNPWAPSGDPWSLSGDPQGHSREPCAPRLHFIDFLVIFIAFGAIWTQKS